MFSFLNIASSDFSVKIDSILFIKFPLCLDLFSFYSSIFFETVNKTFSISFVEKKHIFMFCYV